MPDTGPRSTNCVRAALARARERLAAAGVDTAALDARILLSRATGRDTAWIVANPDAVLTEDAGAAFAQLIARREAREPVPHILGTREFWSLEFRTGPDVLTPRPDSETLVEAVLDHRRERKQPIRILDLGTGSGCLLLALLSEYPDATGLGVDVSEAALAIAAENALHLGLAERAAWVISDWTDNVDGQFDVVVSNPPYIETAAIADLEPEVARYEPRGALDGGPDGCDPYRTLFAQLPRVMAEQALVVFEHGVGQSDSICAMADAAGLRTREVRRDLSGTERVVVLDGLRAR